MPELSHGLSRRQFVVGAASTAALAGLGLVGCTSNSNAVNGDATGGKTVASFDGHQNDLPNIVILATGGTIAGKGESGKATNYKPGEVDVQSLVDSADLSQIANVQGEQVCNINSDDISSDQWIQIAQRINELSSDSNIDGFVVTHGTDTMDETAYFLDLTVKTDKPVVLTGSMRPSTAISADGPMNLQNACVLAGSSEAKGKGVMVAFSDAFYSARMVRKINSFRTDAFSDGDFGAMGYICEGKAIFMEEPTKAHTTQTEFDPSNMQSSDLGKVSIAYFNADADAGILDYFVDQGARAIVIVGAGNGEYSKSWIQKIDDIGDKCVFVRTSRIPDGTITHQDVYDKDNVITGADLLPQKVAILMRLGLSKTDDPSKLQDMLKKY